MSQSQVPAPVAEGRAEAETLLAPYRIGATETLRGRVDPITIWTRD